MKPSMSRGLREYLKEHYLSESLATERLNELHDVLRGDGIPQRSIKSREVRLRFYVRVAAVAASLALVAIPLSYELGKRVGESSAELRASGRREDVNRVIPDQPAVRLVAIKMHADWCNRCPMIAPIFDRIERDYGARAVLFVTLDVTDDVRRRQSEQLAEALGIRWILNRELPTGIIALVDRAKQEILAIASEPDDGPLLALAIRDRLPD